MKSNAKNGVVALGGELLLAIPILDLTWANGSVGWAHVVLFGCGLAMLGAAVVGLPGKEA